MASTDQTKPPPWLQDDGYLRGLDSLGRFFNSQITVHVGYLISSFIAILGVFSLTREWIVEFWAFYLRLGLPHAIRSLLGGLPAFLTLVSFIGVVILYLEMQYPYPIFFAYLLGRLQLYVCLSQIVWDHMGVTEKTTDTAFVRALEDRARTFGINGAVMTRFEFILYYTLRKRQNNPSYDEAEKLYHMEHARCEGKGYETRVFRFWKLPELLLLAYPSLHEYKSLDPEKYNLWESTGVFDR